MGEESGTQRLIMDWLAAKGIFSVRLNSGAVKLEGRFLRFSTPGCADILACPKGKPAAWLEVKSRKGRQSPEQKSFQQKVEAAGHLYIVARNLDDVIAALEN